MDIPTTLGTCSLTKKAKLVLKPENWIDLPDHIWTRVMKLLLWSDLNNMHLVCKKFNEVASNYVPHKLILGKVYRGSDNPVRYFDAIHIVNDEVVKEFQRVTRIMEKIGVHVKKLSTRNVLYISRVTIHELMLFLPNLEVLDLGKMTFIEDRREPPVGKVEISALKILKLNRHWLSEITNHSCVELFVLNHLELPALEDFEVATENIEEFVPFLKSHEKTLKKLKVHNKSGYGEELLEFFGSSLDLRLECLLLDVLGLNISNQKFLNFLELQEATLKTLTLVGSKISNKAMNHICESLPNLETLELLEFYRQRSEPLTIEGTDNLCKLKNLKKLNICFTNPNFNYLRGLTLAVNENLHTLVVGNFLPIPLNLITNLPIFIPNLKELRIHYYPCELIDLLKLFKNLEHLFLVLTCSSEYHKHRLIPLNDVVAKNLKHLEIWSCFGMDPPTATKIARDYPNLESIQIPQCSLPTEESVEILLKNLKQLRDFNIIQLNEIFLSKEILQHIKNYGKKLTKFTVGQLDFGYEEIQEVLKDFRNFTFSAFFKRQFVLQF